MPQPNYFVHTLLRARDWQHRPQFDEVCNWWREGGHGVCALVGMGGAGKTAVAERFLNELLDARSRSRQTLDEPHSLFVYSFYDDDKPENFFRHLQFWLEGTSAPNKQKSPTQLMFDIQQHQGLIILDGLEKVQESGARGGFGRLTSPSLRDLLNHIACGSARDLSVLVTSRFPLTDLRDSHPRFFHMITVDEFDLAAGIALLRDRGVRGTDVQLAPIVEHCGRHALTIDLAGGYIKEYGHGDPSTLFDLGTAEELRAEADQEPDDEKRAVLDQGVRLARIAQRYREAMLSSDEAALALLERICLFRLGVDCETFAAIFTGPAAENVAGKALASLDADQLQKKLNWLVRMRILERSNSTWESEQSKKVVYTIHPAVREGFVTQIDEDIVRSSHSMICDHLENPSNADSLVSQLHNPVVLDSLEEVLYHKAFSDRDAAWEFYTRRMGGHKNLRVTLGQFARGERICRMIAGRNSPEVFFPRGSEAEGYDYRDIALILDWGHYLANLGHLASGLCCIRKYLQHLNHTRPDTVAEAYQSYGEIYLFQGRIIDAKRWCRRGQRCAQKAKMTQTTRDCLVIRASCFAMQGWLAIAFKTFELALDYQKKLQGNDSLCGDLAVAQALIHVRVGAMERAQAIVQKSTEELPGNNEYHQLLIDLLKADIARRLRDAPASSSLVVRIRNRAIDSEVNEVICWSSLMLAQEELSMVTFTQKAGSTSTRVAQTADRDDNMTDSCVEAESLIADGLQIARNCGYGLYHIDLLLERARLHLLRGDAVAAQDDIDVALDTGIPANEELLAANHEACGYAWAIPAGLQLRAEAMLLQAAQQIGSDSFAPARIHDLPPEVIELIDRAKQLLQESLELWQPLHDPEPERDDQNFQLDGKEYNYRAAETNRIDEGLAGGILTHYPLTPTKLSERRDEDTVGISEQKETKMSDFDVFLSHNSKDKPDVKRLGEALKKRALTVWLDEWELAPGSSWIDELENIVTTCGSSAVCVGANGLGPWEEPEMQALLIRFMKEKKTGNAAPVIPVLLPGAPDDVKLPVFLQTLTWLDLRDGLKKEGLDRLQWGITGVKPNP